MKRLAPVAGLEPGDRIIHGDLPATVTGAPVQEATDSLSFYVHVDGAVEQVRVYRHVAAWIEPIHPALDAAAPPSAAARARAGADLAGAVRTWLGAVDGTATLEAALAAYDAAVAGAGS